MRAVLQRFEVRVSLIYLAAASAWIIASDLVAAWLLVGNVVLLELTNTYKSLAFVGITTVALFAVLKAEAQRRSRADTALREEVRRHIETEKRLEQTTRLCRLLGSTNQVVVRATNEEQLLQDICNLLVTTGGYHMAWIGYAEPDKRVRVCAAAGHDEGYLGQIDVRWDDSEMGQGPTGTAIRTGQPSVVRVIQSDPRFAPWRALACARGYASSIALPLRVEHTVIGAINVYAAVEGAFDAEETSLLTELAADLAFGILALRRATENYVSRTTLEQERDISPVGITILSADGRITYANARAERMLGLTHANLLQQPYNAAEWRITAYDGSPFPDERLPFAIVKRTLQPVYGVKHALVWDDGSRVLLDINAAPLFEPDGSLREVITTLYDITDEYTHRQRLTESEERYRLLVNSLADYAVFAMDADGYVTSWSSGAERILGYSAAEILGQHFSVFYQPADAAAGIPAQILEQARQQGYFSDQQWRMRKDGTRFWAEVYMAAVRDADGLIKGFSRVIRDLSERKQAEEHIRYLANLIESVSDAVISTDMAFNLRSWNKAAEALYGWRAEEVIGRPIDDVLPTTYPDNNRDEVLAHFQQMGSWRGEVIQPHRDGTPIDIMSSVSLTFDSEGNPIGAVGINRDIRERKRSERALQRYNQRLQLLRQIDLDIISAKTPEEITSTALRHIRQLIPAESAAVVLLDDNRETASVFAYDAAEGRALPARHRAPIPHNANAATLESGQVLLLPDLLALPEEQRSEFVQLAISRGLRAALSAPFIVEGRLIGSLNLGSITPGAFTAAHAEIIAEIGNQLAIAFHNARLGQAVHYNNQELQQLSARLVKAQESERLHIARELHDQVGQTLTALGLLLDVQERRHAADNHPLNLGDARELVTDLTRRIREMSLDLRPLMLDDLGLIPTLVWHLGRFQQQTGIAVDLRYNDVERRFAPIVETTLYRIIQEALTNIARHAQVTEAAVRLWADAENIQAQVEDEGVGFDVEKVSLSHNSSGLLGLRERAQIAGGHCYVDSSVGSGTVITVVIPLQAPTHEEPGV